MTYSDYNIDLPPGRTTGQVYAICPKCSHDRKKKHNKCLGINLDLGVWHCMHCDWKGSIHKKHSALPHWENKTSLSDHIVEWFLQRNISQDTLVEMKVTESTQWMPQVQDNRRVICFNYFRDGQFINVKYRDREKNFKMYKDAELIFYNLDGIKGAKEAYIVEGEMDCLTMVQAGFKNTVSVPNGANKKSNNLDYLDNCYQYFEHIDKVYILTDNDEPGEQLGSELARRIGVEKCYRVDIHPYKDANEQLCKLGKVDVSKVTPYPITGIYSIDDHWAALEYLLRNGFPKGWKPRDTLGDHVQFFPGFTSIITGIPGHGKSEILDQILLQLCLDYNLKGSYFTPENWPTEVHLLKLVEKVIGKTAWGNRDTDFLDVKSFFQNRIFWIYPEEGYGLDAILNKVRQAVLKYGINWFVLDPWNKLEHQDDSTNYISRCLDTIANFTKKNGVHAFIVAHPTKMRFDQDRGKYDVPTLYDISGSAHFYNKADLGFCMYKNEDGKNTFNVLKVKFKYWGKIGSISYNWNSANGRYDEYGMDTKNWLIPKQEPKLIDFAEPRTGTDDDIPF
ncbi:MAG: toprim domain-containing protein [Bacteroidetes bacterium]|nr:toprim domain-containing protein [Bacteroidota bacterium]